MSTSQASTPQVSTTMQAVIEILDRNLQLGERAKSFDADTPLLGELPEFDSMAVVSVITGVEEHFGIAVDDDEIEAETFETVGSVTAFVERHL